jgi:saccharopepsin
MECLQLVGVESVARDRISTWHCLRAGEVDPRYQSILNTDPIPTFPVISPNRWSVLVDSIVVGSKQIPLTTSVADAPSTKAVVLLDSGTSYSFVQFAIFCCFPAPDTMHRYASPEVCKAIYGSVQGARLDSNLGQWVVPCDAEIDVALQIKSVHISRSRFYVLMWNCV